MIRIKNRTKKGFLLIEAIIYLFVFSIIIIGAIYTFFSILESNQKLSEQNLTLEEGEFLIRKVEHLITSVEEIMSPSKNETSDELRATSDSGVLKLRIEGGNLVLQEGNETFPLNNSRFAVSDLLFERQDDGSTFFIIKTSFILNEKEFRTAQIKYD